MLNKAVKIFCLLIVFSLPFISLASVSFFGGAITCEQDPCRLSDVVPVIGSMITFLAIRIVVPFAIIAIAFAGLKMIMGSNNPGEVASAKNIIYYALLGVFFAFAAYLLVKAILFGLSDTSIQSPEQLIQERTGGGN